MRGRRAFTASLLSALLVGAAPPGGTLVVDVGNVRSAKGNVHIDICPEAKFLKDDCPYSGQSPARIGATTVIVRNLPAGRYAVQAFDDENANGKVDRALFGIPKEGVGFSRDARIGLGPPKWNDAYFDFDGRGARIVLHMRYFLGAKGPPPR